MARREVSALLCLVVGTTAWGWSTPAIGLPASCEPPPAWDDRPDPRSGPVDEDAFDDPGYGAGQARVDRNREPVRAYVDEHVDEFGGLFVDAFDGLVYVAFTDHRDRHRTNLSDRVLDPEAVRVVAADHSLAELRAVQAQIGTDNLILRDLGIQISAVGADERANRVMVMLAELDDAGMNEFCTRYGADLFVFEEGVIRTVPAPGPRGAQPGDAGRPFEHPKSPGDGGRGDLPRLAVLAAVTASTALAIGLWRRRATASPADSSATDAAAPGPDRGRESA